MTDHEVTDATAPTDGPDEQLSRALRAAALDAVEAQSGLLVDGFRARREDWHVSTKTNAHDLVTVTDRAIERGLRAALRAASLELTGAEPGFWGEEFGRTLPGGGGAAGLVPPTGVEWIIDPIDGTSNYVHGFTPSSISVAAAVDGRVVAGVVADPVGGQVFSADAAGAYLNGEPLGVGEAGGAVAGGADQDGTDTAGASFRPAPERLADYNLVTSFPAAEILGRSQAARKAALEIFGELVVEYATVRRIVSGALELCYAAAGWADVVLGRDTKPWDVAAGSYILRQAGGRYLTAGAVSTSWGQLQDARGRLSSDLAHLAPHYAGVAPGRSAGGVERARYWLERIAGLDGLGARAGSVAPDEK